LPGAAGRGAVVLVWPGGVVVVVVVAVDDVVDAALEIAAAPPAAAPVTTSVARTIPIRLRIFTSFLLLCGSALTVHPRRRTPVGPA